MAKSSASGSLSSRRRRSASSGPRATSWGRSSTRFFEDDDGELSLRFSFDLELQGVEAGSAQETEYEATMKGDYEKAVEATLAAIRRWVREGETAGA